MKSRKNRFLLKYLNSYRKPDIRFSVFLMNTQLMERLAIIGDISYKCEITLDISDVKGMYRHHGLIRGIKFVSLLKSFEK